MLSFQDLWFFIHNFPEAEAQRSSAHDALRDRDREHARNSFGLPSQCYLNEKPLFFNQHLVIYLYC